MALVTRDPRITAAARELIRRQRGASSFASFCVNVPIPTVLFDPPKPDEDIVPAECLFTVHHRLLIAATERTINRPFGRALFVFPPGSAKSTYTNNLLPPYVMGRQKKFKLITTSYASELAWTQSRRAMQIVDSPEYRSLAWASTDPHVPLELTQKAMHHWALNNGSECIATGLTAGLTGNRAHGAVIDDPVAGREEADSETVRQKILDAYQDDLLSRLVPEAWLILIMTRWHEDDLAGNILPESYKGESGMIRCRDGLDWEVLNVQAKCERLDDPLGRQLGEYMWPEFTASNNFLHWKQHELAAGKESARKWSSLYQGRPTQAGSGEFNKKDAVLYDREEMPPLNLLAVAGFGDYAVSSGKNDFTEQAVIGLDADSNIWFLDWWYEQSDSEVWSEQMLWMAHRWKVPTWYNEGGVIDKATRPMIMKAMRESKTARNEHGKLKYGGKSVYFDLRTLPSMQDKVAKCTAFQARFAARTTYWPRWQPWTDRVLDQLEALPNGRFDDAADVCGLVGRAIDKLRVGDKPKEERKRGIRPYSVEWLEHAEKAPDAVRYR